MAKLSAYRRVPVLKVRRTTDADNAEVGSRVTFAYTLPRHGETVAPWQLSKREGRWRACDGSLEWIGGSGYSVHRKYRPMPRAEALAKLAQLRQRLAG